MARPLLAIAFWLAVWQGASLAVGSHILLVGPYEVAVRLTELIHTADFWAAVWLTFGRITLGFVLAAVVGVLLAALSAASDWTEALIAPLIATIRATPVVSFIILLLIWANSSQLATIVSFIMTVPIIHGTVYSGILARPKPLLEMASVFRLPRWRRITAIDVPALLPYFAAGCRTGVGLAWKSGIAAEVIGLPTGTIGERLYQGRIYLETADVFAWTVVVVLLAFASEKALLWLLARLERRLSA